MAYDGSKDTVECFDCLTEISCLHLAGLPEHKRVCPKCSGRRFSRGGDRILAWRSKVPMTDANMVIVNMLL